MTESEREVYKKNRRQLEYYTMVQLDSKVRRYIGSQTEVSSKEKNVANLNYGYITVGADAVCRRSVYQWINFSRLSSRW